MWNIFYLNHPGLGLSNACHHFVITTWVNLLKGSLHCRTEKVQILIRLSWRLCCNPVAGGLDDCLAFPVIISDPSDSPSIRYYPLCNSCKNVSVWLWILSMIWEMREEALTVKRGLKQAEDANIHNRRRDVGRFQRRITSFLLKKKKKTQLAWLSHLRKCFYI